MERIATPNILVLFASLSLWTMAFTASPGNHDVRSLSSPSRVAPALISHEEEVRNGMAGESLLEEGTPIVTAASGHWF